MNFTTGRIVVAVLGVMVVFFGIILAPMMVENMDASEIMVVQSPISGELTVYADNGGWKWQGFGTVTKYPRRNELRFMDPGCAKSDLEKTHATSGGFRRLRAWTYREEGTASCSSVSRWTMPSA